MPLAAQLLIVAAVLRGAQLFCLEAPDEQHVPYLGHGERRVSLQKFVSGQGVVPFAQQWLCAGGLELLCRFAQADFCGHFGGIAFKSQDAEVWLG